MRLFGKLLGRWRGALAATLAEEHIAALPDLLERFPPTQVMWAGPTHAKAQPATCSPPCPRQASSLSPPKTADL